MAAIYRIIGVLLLGAMVAGLPDAQAFAFALPAAQPAHSAGCHGHGGAVPAPEPVSYQCCAGGHHAAVPAAAFIPDALAVQNWRCVSDGFLSSSLCQYSATSVDPSNSPPGSAPLRI
jgi:hypothetical protein